jgi:hypothetical protein
MAGITLAVAEAQLAAWLAADEAVAKGQAYSVGGRSVTRADAAAITEKINFWDRKVQQLQGNSSGGARVRHGVLIT